MRASRLLAIMVTLQLQTRVKAEDLAAEFEVSLRTIYRDVDELSAAGIPIQSERGPGGGFQLMPSFRNPVAHLESKEAAALFMIGLPGPALALGLEQDAQLAARKLLANLPPGLREESARLANCFYLDTDQWYEVEQTLPMLPRITRAILEREVLSMDYQSWKSQRRWQLHPYGLVLKAGQWYVVGLSRTSQHKSSQIRHFKVSQMTHLAMLDTAFDGDPSFDLARYWQASIAQFEQTLRPHRAHLQLSALGLQRLAEAGKYARIATEQAIPSQIKPSCFLVELPFENIDQATRLILSLGAECTVLEPRALRERICEVANQILVMNSSFDS